MTVVTTYVADDGKSFLTSEECIQYEVKQTFSNIKLWDRDYNPLPITIDNLKYTIYFKVSTPKAFEAYRDWLICNDVEDSGLDSGGWDALWEWDDIHDYWVNVTEQYTVLRDKVEKMK